MFFDNDNLLGIPQGRAAYSDRTAWLMAECSGLAYFKFEEGDRSEKQLAEQLGRGHLELIQTFNREGTQGYLAARKPSFAVLAFRGTEKDFRDILTDLNIRFYKDPAGGKVQAGFSRAYAVVADEVKKALEKLAVPLYITGHSLGGALATIASMRIAPSDRIAACYTFGSPRVGDAEFEQKLYKVPVYRVVHAADIVSRVPLMAMGYRHTGDLRYLTRKGTVLRNPLQLRLLFRFIYSVVRSWRTIFRDHAIAAYSGKLATWAEDRQK